MSIHLFGIRHHGPGSARSLKRALESLQPDTILVEGPPEADQMLPLMLHPDMEPPVALLIYAPDQPRLSVYYPFAIFSPEWQAIRYGLTNQIPVRFMDLPQTHRLAKESDREAEQTTEVIPQTEEIHRDPLGWLAQAAGYSDGERWWEHFIEHRRDRENQFDAVLEAMTALREAAPPSSDLQEAKREAYMRNTIRAAQKEGFQKIAVVCGAWHTPALAKMPPVKEDNSLLKGLSKTKVEATWVPWTYGRLAYRSGYGAGIESPGWYDHLWRVDSEQSDLHQAKSEVVIRWITKVARLLRAEDLDASSAHIIEAVRLAEALAALRDRTLPGLLELNEAIQSVLCFGSDIQMKLIHEKLIVGERLGKVPDETPMVPLQQDLRSLQKKLRLPPEPTKKTYDLDQRKPNDLQRSQLLYRLDLLEIPWGKREKESKNVKGTFHEIWSLQWQPEFEVMVIEKGIWGNTIDHAAANYAIDIAQKITELPKLAELLDKLLLADLPNGCSFLMKRLESEAAVASDIGHLMETLPALARIMRYGNIRKTDTETISEIVNGLITRICIGLPNACASLDDDAARIMYERINQVNSAIALIQNQEYQTVWHNLLVELTEKPNLHGLLGGRCCRLLLDAGIFVIDEAARRMGLALSTAIEPHQAAVWVEGFIKGSGLLLLHDDKLWEVLDRWVTQLNGDTFTALLPLLRRTFSSFSAPERRQMGEKVRGGKKITMIAANISNDFDEERANSVLPLLGQILGL